MARMIIYMIRRILLKRGNVHGKAKKKYDGAIGLARFKVDGFESVFTQRPPAVGARYEEGPPLVARRGKHEEA